MALPTAATPGYGYYYTYTSHPDVACNCLREWLPKLAKLARHKGILGSSENLRVIQCTGGASASAGTHSRGGAFDLALPDLTRWNSARTYRVLGPETKTLISLSREMGGLAWARYDADGRSDGDPWENNEHIHGVLNGCPHLSSTALDQVAEYKRGGDGLVGSGRDPHPRPSVLRTWKQGLAWADAQMNTTTTTDWFDMATKADLQAVVRAELARPEFLREVARFVLEGYAFDHDSDTSTTPAVLAHAIRDLPDQVWEEKAEGNPYELSQHVLNANVKAGLALHAVTEMQATLNAIAKKLGA